MYGLCRNCVHFVHDGGNIYCEYEMFPDVPYNKSKLYCSTDFDCEHFNTDDTDTR